MTAVLCQQLKSDPLTFSWIFSEEKLRLSFFTPMTAFNHFPMAREECEHVLQEEEGDQRRKENGRRREKKISLCEYRSSEEEEEVKQASRRRPRTRNQSKKKTEKDEIGERERAFSLP